MSDLWQILFELMQRSGHQLRIHEGRTTPYKRTRTKPVEWVVWHDVGRADADELFDRYTRPCCSRAATHIICDGHDLYVVCPVDKSTKHLDGRIIDEAKTGCTNANSIGIDVVSPGAASALVGAALIRWLGKVPTDALGMMLHDEVLPWWDMWDAIQGVWRQGCQHRQG